MNLQTILGAGGSIGSLLARELRSYTGSIRLVSRNPQKVNETDELLAVDLTLPGMADKAVEGSDVVYLVIGLDYSTDKWQAKWPRLMRQVIDACIKHKSRLVFLDNVYLYDEASIPHMTEISTVDPPGRKGMIRRDLVSMIMDGVRSGKLMALIARSADFYGPGIRNSLINEIVYKRMAKGSLPFWFLNASAKHSFTFVPDAARATALLGNTDDAFNQIWHLPTDNNTLTIREIIDIFAREMNRRGSVFEIPIWLLKMMGLFSPVLKEMIEMSYQYDRDYVFDSSKFMKRFDFRVTSYAEGIKMTVHPDETKVYYGNRITNTSTQQS